MNEQLTVPSNKQLTVAPSAQLTVPPKVLSLQLDPSGNNPHDVIQLAHSDNVARTISELISNPQAWVKKAFGRVSILGPRRDVITIHFVSPLDTGGQAGIDVEFVNGTNLITVRRSSEALLQFPMNSFIHKETTDLNITLHEGLAFCHYHIADCNQANGRVSAAHVQPGILQAILDPKGLITEFGKKTIFKPSYKMLSQDGGIMKVADIHPDRVSFISNPADLRFIYQWCKPRQTGPPTQCPCSKPAGTYTQSGESLVIKLDTICFMQYVDYPQVPQHVSGSSLGSPTR